MTREAFAQHGLPGDFAARVGEIVRARGPLVEARFAPDALPPVLNALTIADQSHGTDLTASVIQHLPDGIARAIVLAAPGSPSTDLAAGTTITNTGSLTDRAVPNETVREAVMALRALASPDTVLETGLKAIDLLCPLGVGGAVGLFGDLGVGKAVLIAELLHNVAGSSGDVAVFTFLQVGDEVAFMGAIDDALVTPTEVVRTFYVAADQQSALASADLTASFDATIYLSRAQATHGFYPAVDPARSTSRLLTPAIVGEEHYRVAQEVRNLLRQYPEAAADESDQLAGRARKLRRFLSQAMFVAEPFTHVPGEFVRREDTVRDCAAILRGDYDHLPEAAFVRIGPIEQAIEKARTLSNEA